jgi:polyisoprenoid-binding protein YceI
MKKLTLLALLVLTPALALAQTTWKADPAHSRISFAIGHLGISEVSGIFKKFDVTITTSSEEFSDAQFKLMIDVASIDTEVEKRDEHLRSPDFFEVAKFPTMTFESAKVQSSGGGRYKLSGNLTMHGQTKPVEMELWYRGTTDNRGKATAGFQLTGTLKRSDFGIGPKFPTAAIGDEVKIKADGEFVKQ